jgi:redox-sensitive bicupin YhaK (pirin superfamily)
MIRIHDRDIRGTTKTGWLDSKHTFSFGHFRDPARMGFKTLRVINDDIVIPGAGFDTHPHSDMEIITYILDGELEHRDSLGTGSVIRPGEVQRMSAGTGIEHSEFNPSNDNGVHLLQIWIHPEARGLKPSYEQIAFDRDAAKGRLLLIGSRQGGENVITIHQDVKLYVSVLEEGQSVSHEFSGDRGGFVQVVRGHVALNGEILKEGDGAEISAEDTITLTADSDAELLLFDLA